MTESHFLNFLPAKASIYTTDRTSEILIRTCFVSAPLVGVGIAVLLPSIIMVCAWTSGGISFSQFSSSQGFHLQNRPHAWDSHAYVLRFRFFLWLWNCLCTAINNYGMRLDKWRDHFFSIFSQPSLPFTKPIARLKFLCIRASFQIFPTALELLL